MGEEAHATIFSALRLLGMGEPRRMPIDDQGRMLPFDLEGPAIVCAQAGNVNSGAFDPLEEIAARCPDAWLHVDGAFGLWAAASSRRSLLRGVSRASSWACDAHKWLNVPYDCGVAIVRDRAAHRAAMSMTAAYFVAGEQRDNFDYTPEASRRARGFTVYAALRSLGRRGLSDLVDRCCEHASLFASLLSRRRRRGVERRGLEPGARGLLRRRPWRAIQAEGTCWAGGTVWHGRPAMRISVSNWARPRTTSSAQPRRCSSCASSLLVRMNSYIASPLDVQRALRDRRDVVAGLVPAGEAEVDQVDRGDAALR